MRRENTEDCAYDAFERELHTKDKVIVCVHQTASRHILYKAEVIGWSKKKVKLAILESATNSDYVDSAGNPGSWWRKTGTFGNYNPDRIYKL